MFNRYSSFSKRSKSVFPLQKESQFYHDLPKKNRPKVFFFFWNISIGVVLYSQFSHILQRIVLMLAQEGWEVYLFALQDFRRSSVPTVADETSGSHNSLSNSNNAFCLPSQFGIKFWNVPCISEIIKPPLLWLCTWCCSLMSYLSRCVW